MTFESLGLHPQILKALTQAGYSTPTEVQFKTISKIEGRFDVRVSAPTGTGKTAAFLLPILHRLTSPGLEGQRGPRALILVPTRELAMQIAVQAEKYSQYLPGIKSVCINGGVAYHVQMRKLSRPYDILIATPGRLIDYLEQKKISFPRLEILVLDEADRMLDMGFLEPVEQIVAMLPPKRQTMLFSATLKGPVLRLSEKLLNKPMDIVVHTELEKNDNIQQLVYFADDLNHKTQLLDHILKSEGVGCTIIFTATKRYADQLVYDLQEKNYPADALHGDMSQRERTRTIMAVKDGRTKILVATDVAARGIDIHAVSHVINFDLPSTSEDYVHRIGRTGRAGAKGIAISFVTRKQASSLKSIEKFTGQPLIVTEIAGLAPRSKQDFHQSHPAGNRFGNKRGFDHPRRKNFRKDAGSRASRPYAKKPWG